MSSRLLPEPRFSIIIVSYNSRENLPACLESCRRAFKSAPHSAEVIVVDNASRDGTGNFLKQSSDVRALLNKENLGFSKACNQGARLAQGEYLVFLNPDTLLTVGACDRMAAAFANTRVGSVGPISNYVAALQKLERHWPKDAGTLENLPGSTVGEKSDAISEILAKYHNGVVEESKLLIGFCLMIRRTLFLSLGGFDENLFLGNDDLELSWRLRLRGYQLIVACDAFVFHEGQKSFRSDSKSVTDVLVQESTDALFRKLSLHFGGDEKVPTPEELWGIGWFNPSPAAYSPTLLHQTSEANMLAATQENSMPITMPKVEDGLYLHYPDSLRNHLLDANQVGFMGSVVGPIATSGAIHGVNLYGQSSKMSQEDLAILRITPDLIENLPARLQNLRNQLPQLNKLITVLNSRQALGKPPHPRGFEIPIDVTSEGICAALRLSGYRVNSIVPYPGFPGTTPQTGPRIGWWQLDAEPRTRNYHLSSKVSIILLGFNQLEYTRQCIESIQRNVKQEYELILIDNGSRDGTWAYFQSISGAITIRNENNRGVSAGWNQGLRVATGDYLLVLNNDTLIFPHMLENLVRLCESDTSIGLVGPRCNKIAAAQAVEGIVYNTSIEMESFAQKWQSQHDLGSAEYDWIKGTCMLIPRRAFDKIGFFDERFGKGNFEDDDYSLRTRYHGFKTCIAHDSYLHHYGSVSFGQENIDWNALMVENQQKFEMKWQFGASALNDVQVSGSDDVHQLLEEGRQAYARGEIQKSRNLFLRLLDTQPGHAEALSALGALAFNDCEYRDAALLSLRSLIHRPEDSDTAKNLLDALEALNGKVSGLERDTLRQRFSGNPGFAETQEKASWVPVTETSNTLWRAHVEEDIRAGRYSDALDQVSLHVKSGTELGTCHNFMGVIAMALQKPDEALEYFRKAVRFSPEDADFILNLVESLLRLNRIEESLQILEEAKVAQSQTEFDVIFEQLKYTLQSTNPSLDALFLSWDINNQGEKLLREGRCGETKTLFLNGHLEKYPEDFRAWNNLGIALFQLGEAEDAWNCFANALDTFPTFGDALVNVFDASIPTRKREALLSLIDNALKVNPNFPLALRLRQQLEREGQAFYTSLGLDALEKNSQILELAETELKQGQPHAALIRFLDAVEKRPDNPQAMNGLGIIAFGQNHFEEAYALFKEAARLNPEDQDILVNLWEAARAMRREKEARPALEASLNRNPQFHDLREILSQTQPV